MAASAPPTLEPLSKIATATLRSWLGNHSATVLLAPGQLKSLAYPQQKSKCGKTESRTGKSGEDVHHRPEAYRQSQAEPGAHSIEEDASQQPRNRVGHLKCTENPAQIGMAEVVLDGQHRRASTEKVCRLM